MIARRMVTTALAVAVVAGLVGCEPPPPETLPGHHGSGRTPVAVCPTSTPAGLGIRRAVFTVLNQREDAQPQKG